MWRGDAPMVRIYTTHTSPQSAEERDQLLGRRPNWFCLSGKLSTGLRLDPCRRTFPNGKLTA